jgi:hypothetical protein
MSNRFTIDGSDELEVHLVRTCERVRCGVEPLIGPSRLEALVLGGGYGRGEGGVWRSESGDRPYNDLEFYVFVRGNPIWNERRHRRSLAELGERLSPEAGVHVEFKVDSIRRLRRSPVTMFSYDLAAGHRVVSRNGAAFRPGAHHLKAGRIPLSEATRLLFNRCSGLLLARELLRRPALTAPQADFVARNLAKAQLALGDAVLAAFGQYHWSCPERNRRLILLAAAEALPWLDKVREYHGAGVEFKLHPRLISQPAEVFVREHREVSELALQIWLWLESRRLARPFGSARDYAFSGDAKCPGTSFWRNYLSNLRTFGYRAALDSLAGRYPRERLFNALALLLWNGELPAEPDVMRRLQQQLRTTASDWGGFVRAYEQVWPAYG